MKMTKREIAIEKARICGYKCDKEGYIRLLIESRVNASTLQEAYSLGQKQAEAKIFG